MHLKNGNCNIYLGVAYKHHCIGITCISDQWDLHFSAFEITTPAFCWVADVLEAHKELRDW